MIYMGRVFILVLVCVLFCDITYGLQKNILIVGKILNYDNALVLEDISELGELRLVSRDQVAIPDSAGYFRIEYDIKEPNYFRIGRNILFIQPKDTLSVVIDYLAPEKSIFKGKNAIFQEYLKFTPYPKAGSYLEAGYNVKVSLGKTIDTLESIKTYRKNRLDNYKGITSSFRELENVRIEADFLNSIYSLQIYYVYKNKIQGDSLRIFKENYQDLIEKYSLKMPYTKLRKEYMKLTAYRIILPQLIRLIPADKSRNDFWNEWFESKGLREHMENAENRDSLEKLSVDINKIKNDEFRSSLLSSLQKFMLYGNGDDFVNFGFKVSNDSIVRVDEFKGKVIYIDLWATWCGPCLKELKYLQQLKEKFKDKNVVFLSISIDTDINKWKDYLAKNLYSEYQGIVDQYELKDFNIATIPRVIVVNKFFKIEEMNGPLPSSPNATDLLERLIK
jgi:thiol-disulfide isomerase/thioredoxin